MKSLNNHILSNISAKKLAIAALIIWLCSLMLTGFVTNGTQKIPGFYILVMGWLSALIPNFAWFANLFFLFAALSLIGGNKPFWPSIFSALLTLDTFRFDLMPDGHSYGDLVTGYGWGVVLWFFSIFLLLVSLGSRLQENPEDNEQIALGRKFYISGFFFCSVILVMSGFYSIYDHVMGNHYEKERLTGVAFKRGEICQVEPFVIDPIRNFAGPLEVVLDKKALHPNYYPFKQPRKLLEWGIPIIRKDGFDYFLDRSVKPPNLISIQAEGKSAAILWVTEYYPRGSGVPKFIRATLVETATSRPVFDQTWNQDIHGGGISYFCPDYDNSPNENEQPRKLLLQALGIDADSLKWNVSLQSELLTAQIRRATQNISDSQKKNMELSGDGDCSQKVSKESSEIYLQRGRILVGLSKYKPAMACFMKAQEERTNLNIFREACTEIAMMYELGWGVDRDIATSKLWLQKTVSH